MLFTDYSNMILLLYQGWFIPINFVIYCTIFIPAPSDHQPEEKWDEWLPLDKNDSVNLNSEDERPLYEDRRQILASWRQMCGTG